MLDAVVNKDKCTKCHLCATDCPIKIIKVDDDGFPFIPAERKNHCIKCQHCLVTCPGGAFSIFGINPDNCADSKNIPSDLQMENMIKTRRSVRKYKTKDVKSEDLDRLLKAVANAPTGKNCREVEFTVINKRSEMAKFKNFVYDLIDEYINHEKMPDEFAYYVHLLKAYRDGNDVIFRNAPHLFIAHSPKSGPTPIPDCYIALTYFELMAASMKIGSVWLGFLAYLFDFMPEIREKLGIPEDHEVPYALLFGHPAVKYYRGVERNDYKLHTPVF